MFKDLIRYTEVADLIFINTFIEARKNMPRAEALFSHVLNAQDIWIRRIKKAEQIYDRLQVHPVREFMEIHRRNITQLRELASDNLDFTVYFKTFQGDSSENKASDIMFHVVNHSTYHRAQVATEFRINNIEPPITDYVYLKRENLL